MHLDTAFDGLGCQPIVTMGIQFGCIHRVPPFTEQARSRADRLLTVNTTTRRTAPALLFVLMLSFAVCLWGLHYKLSLYHVGATRAAGPAAKLLSQKERPVSSKDVNSLKPVSLQPQSSTLFPTLLIAAIAVGSHLVFSYWTWMLTADVDCHQRSCVNSLCFSPRPPPALPLYN